MVDLELVKSGAFGKLVELFNKLAGPLADEVGMLMADKIKVYRVKNWVNVVKKCAKILKDANLPPNAVPPRIFLPIMEASSIEDNEILQDKWAGLLASASEKSDSLSPSFVETLKELTPNEAKVLHSLFEVVTERDFTLKDAVRSVFKSGEKDPAFQSSIKTFERLGLVDKEYKLQEAAGSHFYKAMRDSAQRAGTSYVPPFVTQALERPPDLSYEFRFTEYGIQFMKACQGPTKTG